MHVATERDKKNFAFNVRVLVLLTVARCAACHVLVLHSVMLSPNEVAELRWTTLTVQKQQLGM